MYVVLRLNWIDGMVFGYILFLVGLRMLGGSCFLFDYVMLLLDDFFIKLFYLL